MKRLLKSNNLSVIKKGDLEYIKFPKLDKLDCVKHIFSTKLGGVSDGDFATMNLSFNRGDKRENVLKNYEILCDAEGINKDGLVLSHQTHTNNVLAVDESHKGTGIFKPSFQDIDGLITNKPGVALVTQYADCTPLLFCDPIKRVVATSHAGWRGTTKLIGKVTVEKMTELYGCQPKNIIAGIGPSILDCCYEVDSPVYNEFAKISFINPDDIFAPKSEGKYMLNLVKANYLILLNAGLNPENIDCSDICTCCNADHLHSHRATAGKRGNLAAIIELV